MRGLQIPLIPAKAGIQIEGRRIAGTGAFATSARAQPYDLDPGLRRDERVLGRAFKLRGQPRALHRRSAVPLPRERGRKRIAP